ncbi:MAG: ATP-binding protein [Pseudomonadota bacterium]
MARLLCLTGAESSGKTTLARALAHNLDGILVPELARQWLSGPSPPAQTEALLEALAAAQRQAEAGALAAASGRWVILDTDVLVLAVWWMERFATADAALWPDWLTEAWAARGPRCYLLCSPDTPWEDDPLRVNPEDRPRLDQRYEHLLRTGTFAWRRVRGSEEHRLTTALEWLRTQDSGDSA